MNLDATKPIVQPGPLVSIVIPMLNERAGLRTLFDRVAQAIQDTPVEWEMVIVDDGSTDSTKEILKEYEARYKVIYQSRKTVLGITNILRLD